MSLSPWKVISSNSVVSSSWLSLRRDVCETTTGVCVDPYYVVETPDWAQVFALNRTGQVLVVRQYRHGAGLLTTELPSGRIDPGETALGAAKRELREETGFISNDWQAISVIPANPARQATYAHGFIARDVERAGEPNLDPTEDIETDFMELGELLDLGKRGEVPAPHLAGVLDALRALGRLG
jgi:8-oxo-dGTP pyrophosphatase MutT (NUDIX family)